MRMQEDWRHGSAAALLLGHALALVGAPLAARAAESGGGTPVKTIIEVQGAPPPGEHPNGPGAGGGESAAAALDHGMELAVAGKIADATESFEVAAALEPGSEAARDAHWQLGQVHFADGNRERAELHFGRYYEMDLGEALLERYNFHGSEEELWKRLKQESAAADSLPDTARGLASSLKLLRDKEQEPPWLARHFVDCHRTVGASEGNLSHEMCAYGTTWLESFIEIVREPAVLQFLEAPAPHAVVLGSALGYQCAWLASIYPELGCASYELLCSLSDMAAQLHAQQDGLHFECRDALSGGTWVGKGPTAGWAATEPLLIWANDYSWGPDARSLLLSKAQEEAPPGSVLLLPNPGVLPGGWALQANLTVATSWNDELSLGVLQRDRPQDKSEL